MCSGNSGTVEEGGLIVVALVGCDGATWSRAAVERKWIKKMVKAMDLLDDAVASNTQDLKGSDLRENALYGFALIRSWSSTSSLTLPSSISFHLRAVLEASLKRTHTHDSIILCHEVVDAILLNDPLLVPTSALKTTASIFDSCRDLGRH
jgi:hypothetical protein